MALAQRFNDVTTDVTRISELDVFRPHPIERANKVTKRFGDTVLLALRDGDDRLLKLFLPQCYGADFKAEDLQAINEWAVQWNLVSKGRSPGKNAYQLAVE